MKKNMKKCLICKEEAKFAIKDTKDYYCKEIKRGSFERSVPLPKSVKKDKVEAHFNEGVLKIILPKAEQGKDETVKIKVKSLDVTHGFGIAGYNINKVINLGETVEVDLVADQKGTFNFICTVPCGPGHSGMKGKLIVN